LTLNLEVIYLAALKDIKTRMQGIEDLKKITGTMYMVSSIRFKSIQNEVKHIDGLLEKLRNIMSKIPFEPKNITGPPLFIVMGSDRGLAGGYNANLLDKVYEKLMEYKNPMIISLGRKIEKFFAEKGLKIIKRYTDIDRNLSLDMLNEIIRQAINAYESGSEIYVAYTHFAGALRLKPKTVKLLPPSLAESSLNSTYIFEPSPEELLKLITKFYLKMSIESFFLHSYVSEQAARMVAMESASDNADELLEDLGTQYHRRRKDIITGEIAEIVSGAEGIIH
jgi:F-type H+-transporting ATPase subunit gamma